MLRSLAVDVGNTNAKFAFFRDGTLVTAKSVVTKQAVASLDNLIARYAPTHAVLSSVGAPAIETRLQKLLASRTKLTVLKRSTPVPIHVMYKSKTLGMDRLALAVFAHAAAPKKNVLAISAGTCITYDFVNAQGNHYGGAISPGLLMRLHAMHDYTVRLPKVALRGPVELTGTTTEGSMLSGAVLGAVNEVNGFIAAYKREHGNLKVILTGGDAPRLEPHLKFKIFARPYAVLEGMQRILQHNLGAL